MGLTVVVIDDHRSPPEALRLILPQYIEDCEVLARKPNKLEGLPSKVDVFIVDYRMEPSGPDVVRALKTSHPNARIIGWSMGMDVSMDVVKKEFMKAETDVVISKGKTPKQLAGLIECLVCE